jgi:two-component system sensor histidine kinase CpxA
MSRIYLKVLVWFLAIVLATGAGLLWLAGRDQTGPPRAGLARRLVELEAEAARREYESGDAQALRDHLRRLAELTGREAILTNSAGKDLVDGSDRSALLRRVRRPRFAPGVAAIFADGRGYQVIPVGDGRYWFFLQFGGSVRRFFSPEIWVLASVGLFTMWLAYRLTKPIRELQATVDRFGQGDLGARVHSRREDEIGQLARSFDQMAGRIESLVASQRRLLTDLSHELRTPLTRLGLAVELARPAAGDRDPALDRIQREADRLNELVGGLLQVTRGEADPGGVRRTPLALEGFLAEVAADHQLEAEARGCRIDFRAGENISVEADAELLRRAVENVLRNAIRYSPPGEVVSMTLARRRRDAVVTIRDRGPGVPGEAIAHLFDAFYRADSSRAGGGFGLGLSIAKRAVELHHGKIRARNAEPGLEVEICLPVGVDS